MQKHSQTQDQSQLIPVRIITDQVWHPHICAADPLSPWTSIFDFVIVHRPTLPNENTRVCIFSIISASRHKWKINNGRRQISTLVKDLIWGFSPSSPQDIYWREIPLRIPGKRWGGRLVEMAHQEDPDCADKKHQSHDNKADPVDHPGNQEPLFILLGLREVRDYRWCWFKPEKLSKC